MKNVETLLIDELKKLYVSADAKEIPSICVKYNAIVEIYNSLEKLQSEDISIKEASEVLKTISLLE